MGTLGKPENLRGFVNIFIFVAASILLLIGIGIYLSPVCTPREIYSFLYNYYKIYFYVIIVLAASMSYFQYIHNFKSTFSEVTYKILVCLLSIGLSYCICNSSTLDNIMRKLSRGGEFNDLPRLLIGLLLSAFLTIAVAAELLAAPTYLRIIKDHFIKFRYELLFFLFLSGKLLLNNRRSINGWVASWYTMDYQHTGFGSRLLPGTILSLLLHNDYIDPRKAYFFIWCTILLLNAILACMFGKCIKKCRENCKEAVIYLILVYLASPMSIEYLTVGMGRLELFVLIFVLFFVIGYNKIKHELLKCIWGCLMSIGYIACHQGGIFLFFPILFTVMVLNMKEQKFKRNSVISTVIICLVNGIGFLIFQFFTETKFHTLDDLLVDVKSRTVLPTSDDALYFEYFSDVKDVYKELCIPHITGEDHFYPRENTYLLLCILFPLLILLTGLWVKAYKNGNKQIYFWLLLSNLSVLPQFILNVDWGRWMSSIIGVQIFQILYLTYKKDSGMDYAMSGLFRFLQKHSIICALILIYLASFNKLYDKGYGNITNNIFWILKTHTLSY